ncbi:resistance to homoserine/threonine (RhtB) family protein [Amycolatopsis xylanica]|uniref:Resistance to homoserine/threonine (RhtB) family protein n=1 Tax=Amycolatopsis xylanica TaxID=589385 RepID=A0A1H3B7F7_9PSEU|nr:LysE family translocator [Amycolatopsis xylanica]SDX37725.1 resistance to homoserine/threonine (RhtB) family protein [Amycolatopsis xylanica]
MTTWGQVLGFAGVVLLAAMSPGPDFAMVLRHSLVSGRKGGLAAMLGVAAGVLVWSVVAVFGLAGLLAASAEAYLVVKLIGAAYLLYLGVQALRAARRGEYTELPRADGTSTRAFRQSMVGNVLNPKCAVFFVALVPQFLPAHASFANAAFFVLVPVAVTVVWFTVVANVVGAMRRMFTKRRVRRAIDTVTGGLLVALGVRLAAQ